MEHWIEGKSENGYGEKGILLGEKEALFAKMKQLEGDEHYELCTMFKSMFDSMNLNKEYLRWAKKITPNVSGINEVAGLKAQMMITKQQLKK